MKKERYQEDDFEGYLEDLIKSGRLEPIQIGITKYCIDNGYEALSTKQKYVFDKIIDENSVEECARCGCDIPWSEMLEALDNGGLCNYCQHMQEKLDSE